MNIDESLWASLTFCLVFIIPGYMNLYHHIASTIKYLISSRATKINDLGQILLL